MIFETNNIIRRKQIVNFINKKRRKTMSKTKDLKNATLEVIDHIHDGWDAYDSCTKFELNRAELIEAFKLEF